MNKTGVFTSCDVPVCRCTFVQLNEETLGGGSPHGEVVTVSEEPGFLWLCSALASRLMACCHSAWRRCGEEHGWGGHRCWRNTGVGRSAGGGRSALPSLLLQDPTSLDA